jgi:carbamoyl-phosphate synthase large subunit
MPKLDGIRKVLILGSGAIKIGEAAEFDYSGSQCLKALREEGIETILVNPNVATIQTDPKLANKIYLLPVTPFYVEEVIKREKPDGILLGFGGQTALNCGVQLSKMGILDKYNVKVLGTPIDAIEKTEDRELFKNAMINAGIPVPKSFSATSVEEALKAAKDIGYPVVVRVAYTLGGKGSGVAHNDSELIEIVERALTQSAISQVLVEEYLGHWKEIEFEIMRDYANNCIAVCCMENVDPMGIHTGDSIVVAPSQTLTNREYHILRSASIRVIQSLGIVGECNIQWALNPNSEEFRVIEVNARMSRSSALASKATGYPLAYISAKLSIGYLLPELINKVTKVTTACFEPALDYVVVKFPRWDFQKFVGVDRSLGTQMKSVGEVMAIGRCFEEALQKAIRMLDIGKNGLVCNTDENECESLEDILYAISHPRDDRIFKIVKAIKLGVSIEKIYELSGIDPFYLYKIKNIVDMEEKLRKANINDKNIAVLIKEAKRLGFSDKQIALCLGVTEDYVRMLRKKFGIFPCVKQIDTLAAEWPAKTNYLYLTYCGDENDITAESSLEKSKVIVLGSGVFRIGSSVEFDWCAVNMVWALKKHGIEEVILINYNPETVSTDYDVSDKLYFEELSLERILDIYEFEKPIGVIVSVGGQIPNNLALKLNMNGVNILGTSPISIDMAEDRAKFSSILDELQIPQPAWGSFKTIDEAKLFASKIGYPVIIRPSYVLSGSSMRVAYDEKELEEYLSLATKVSPEHPVVISKFISGAKEVEVDGVSDGDDTIIGSIIEHVEEAGVHSGDATMCIPPQTLAPPVINVIRDYSSKIARRLKIVGPFNIQFLVKDNVVYVIECNLRASRSFPYTSKTVGVNLIDLVAMAILGRRFRDIGIFELPSIPHVGVKVPQFSFMRLSGADPILGVEMMSTGEVACMGENFADALLKALHSAELNLPIRNGTVLLSVSDRTKISDIKEIFPDLISMGFRVYLTKCTFELLNDYINVPHMFSDEIIVFNDDTAAMDAIRKGMVNIVINICTKNNSHYKVYDDEYKLRRMAVEFNIPLITTIELAKALVKAMKQVEYMTIRSLNEYMDGLLWKLW